MKWKRLSVSATFLGALIGAGFASGREISLYFGKTSLITPLLAGAFLGIFCYLFLLIGSITGGNPLSLWGKGSFFSNAVVKISNAVTLCSMIAASELTVNNLLGINGGGILTGILALITVAFGVEKIKLSNFLIVPVIIALISVLLFKRGEIPDGGKIVFLPAFSYCTMNIIGGGYLVSTMSADFDKKDCAVTAAISGILSAILILAVYFIIQRNLNEDMPLMSAAACCGMKTIGNVVMYLAVFTTMTSSLSIVSDNKLFLSIATVSGAFAVSVLGFRTIVDKCYPVLSVLGGVVSVAYLMLYFIKTRRDNSQPPVAKEKHFFTS